MDFPVVPLSIHLMFSYHFPFPPPAEQEGSSSSADCGVMGGNKPTRHSSSEAVTAALVKAEKPLPPSSPLDALQGAQKRSC